ncbi:Transcriptional regulator, GntR family domain / Aspartate aminotransferase [Cystobacter fuscus DSM 2262]|uniref:Transcriptional regulator, GntR family domain / Aspartate aminotransferase n=1 Tax=Cystobacter fuscus (strain ATCC 25194 / DSM 2262 / NBRC 100088 / M29) TaxID=1242864 RepID=S9P6B5_CYSF2|nr:PLP-dependent aminotransferase family protein [Cystobacter fuscus]EPX57762.1 Transcriptional regulator, GntR family domain / Aspartate aminotransferase [Cystobacter fuscus DSM 2262]
MAMEEASRPWRYEQVAERLAEAMAAGTLRPGDRLPSVRQLSLRERVSISTVLQAYLHLESLGLVETRPQSGHYVRRRERPRPEEPRVSRPPTTAKPPSNSALVARVYRAARDERMVQLGAAVPAPELLPGPRLHRDMVMLSRQRPDAIGYDMPPGCLELRRQVARRALDWGCSLSPDDFITTCGATEAVYLSLAAVARAGDTVAIESPAYYGTLQAMELLGLRALELPSHPRHGLELDALETALDKRRVAAVLVVPSFSNPLGACMPEENRARLVAMLARREIPLIEDDLYGDLHHGLERARTCKSFDREGLVLLCGSVSKTLAPGFRVGWVAPGRFQERLELLKFAHTVATPTLPQLVVARFLASGGYDKHLRTLRRRLASQVERMTEAICEHFPEGTRVSRPSGGSLLWVELPPTVDALVLHARALEAGISIAPGHIFSAQPRYTNCIRLNCGQAWSPRLEAAMATLGSLARTLA